MDDIRCPECGAENKSFWRFCINCGSDLKAGVVESVSADDSNARFCSKCGASNDAGTTNCIACGTSLNIPYMPRPAAYTYDPGQGGQKRIKDREPIVQHENLPRESDTVGIIFHKSVQLYLSNFGTLFGTYWVIYLIMIAASVVVGLIGMVIPLIGNFISIVISPLVIGIYYVYLRVIRGQFGELGQSFSILSEKYVPSLIATIISGFLMMIPIMAIFFVTMGSTFFQIFAMGPGAPAPDFDFFKNMIGGIIAASLFSGIVQMFFGFIFPLIADYETDFWRAITRSVKFVYRNFWEVLLVFFIIFLTTLGGILLLFIGVIFTAPLKELITTTYYEARKNRFYD
jgi:uncharacterized membrane protein